jgi:hypothetical protein
MAALDELALTLQVIQELMFQKEGFCFLLNLPRATSEEVKELDLVNDLLFQSDSVQLPSRIAKIVFG